jgi:hypothetical protein
LIPTAHKPVGGTTTAESQSTDARIIRESAEKIKRSASTEDRIMSGISKAALIKAQRAGQNREAKQNAFVTACKMGRAVQS